jgi:BCL2-associated athanogene 3
VELYSGNSKDKAYLYLDEMLTRELIKLDDIDTDGKENIRQARKEAIRSIQRAISLLESKVQKTESKAAAETDPGQSTAAEAMEVEPDASQSQESK